MARRYTGSVLVYRKKLASRTTVRKQYIEWRDARGIPLRCDDASCAFHKGSLVWNGKSLPLILDHVHGNNSDNRPEKLRFLCPNCDSQNTVTRGGANRGRIEKSEGGFAIVTKSTGRRDYFLPLEPAKIEISGQPVTLTHRRAQKR